MTQSFARGWYAILPVAQIKLKPIAIARLGVDLVVWRDINQEIVVMQDLCPHRSAKLSLGKVCDGQIICPFHGFRFSANGSCSYAPEFDKPIPGLKVKTYKIQIAVGMVWINFGDDSEPLQIEALIDINNEFKAKYSFISKIFWSSHITRCIENQLDYTHLPLVHHNTIGRNFKLPTDPHFIQNDNGIKIFHKGEIKGPSSEYIFPNAWMLNISNKMKLVVYFVPISESKTEFYIFAYRKFLNNKLFKHIFDLLFKYSNRVIIKQDQKVVESQGIAPSFLAKNELLMRHDTAIRMFRELWQSKL